MLTIPQPPTIPTTKKSLERRVPLTPIETITAYRTAEQFADTLAQLAHPNQAQRQYFNQLSRRLHQFRMIELSQQP